MPDILPRDDARLRPGVVLAFPAELPDPTAVRGRGLGGRVARLVATGLFAAVAARSPVGAPG